MVGPVQPKWGQSSGDALNATAQGINANWGGPYLNVDYLRIGVDIVEMGNPDTFDVILSKQKWLKIAVPSCSREGLPQQPHRKMP